MKKTAGKTLYLPRRSFRGDGRNAQGGGNPDWEYYEYKEGNMAAREPWAVELALEPSGTETTWKCRNMPAGATRHAHIRVRTFARATRALKTRFFVHLFGYI